MEVKTNDTQSPLDMWVEENIENIAANKFRVLESIYSKRSRFQQVDLVRTKGHGLMLFLDGLVMCSERDEFVYHDMITHVPMFVHPDPRRVLIIGGGDGGTAREVLRHKGVEHCTMVEIDGDVVDVCKEYFHQTSCSLGDPRLDLRIEDGVRFMAETDQKFDVVMIDSTDPIGPATPLFGEAFYKDVHRVLAEDGIAVAQGESPFYQAQAQQAILHNVRTAFSHTYMYNYSNLCYPGGLWSFVMATKGLDPLADFDEARVAASGLEFQYYNPALHRGAFALPEFQRRLYEGLVTPWRD
ncbi:polyamine aminopropyltransferase [Sulfidibacter corallicola]|uniref:Polyamine aminopropyltransferase n=1 Tax=Sulfidibacter corallicola TaxID=2818388 RepID=A0A8A4TRR4_SULCO|nr:polyamine aminopropyltransferase [Sulfidibacter corallicola]QTD52669.1 polyamine aminopropyltransferase [Sulfidibacter corallicola]